MELTSTTVGGWATIIAVAGGIYYISNRKEKSKRPASIKQVSKPLEVKKDTKPKKGKKTALQSDGDSEVKSGADKKKKTKKPTPAPVPAKIQPVQSEQPSYADVADDKEEQDNKEFARRMAATKAGGAIGATKTKVEARQKSVKQSRAQEKQEKPGVEFSSDNLTAPSSANGGDADDDQSPINSPELSATTVESPVRGGVSDMLEKPSAGPSVLKISAPTNPGPEKKQKTQAPAAPVESKKQRQNRQKAEAQKAQREADEAGRQKLMEESRRNARLAEGRAAKDGSSFMASTAPTYTSQWSAPPPTTNGTSTSDKKVQLLDTNESVAKPAESPAEAGSKWETNISEEDQIRIFTENENWETVKNDKKKRVKKAGESSADDESKDFGVPPKTAPSNPGQKYQVKTAHVETTEGGKKKVVERDVELQDDEWEVS